MSGLTLPGLSTMGLAPTTQGPTATSGAELAKRGKITETAQAFEASFLSIMISQMFEGVETEAPFSGGDGEKMFRSFFSDAIAKQVSKSGGLGLADSVSREMLKLQGLQ